MYFNSKYAHVGHVFQDRFKAVRIENDRYLRHLSAYIHLNPKVAGLVKATVDWGYSSYPEYIGTREDAVCEKDLILDQFSSSKDYQRFVENNFDDSKLRKRVAGMIIDE